jgi:hypothetical protein
MRAPRLCRKRKAQATPTRSVSLAVAERLRQQ